MSVISLPNILEGRERQLKRLRTRLKDELDATCGMLTSEPELVSLPQIATILQRLRQVSEHIETLDISARQTLACLEEIVIEINDFAGKFEGYSVGGDVDEDIAIANEAFLRR